MASYSSIPLEHLAHVVGTRHAPAIIDLRSDDDFGADPLLIPGSTRRSALTVGDWGKGFADRAVVVVCRDGGKVSQAVAARLRHDGVDATSLAGGLEAWQADRRLMTRAAAIPPPGPRGCTVWVTRERPKIDRIACPWLIRRFVDPDAVFLFVEPSEVAAIAEPFNATPFDIEGVFWSHRGETCTFDTMLTEFGLKGEALDRLASIVRGADTARLDLAPQAAGFLAASLGLSQLFDDDLTQLEAGMMLYDAMYLWCRDATGETHNWPKPGAQRQ